jgi:hypothetical protein
MLANAHFAQLNYLRVLEIAELTSSAFDETDMAILKLQGGQEIPIVSLQRNIRFDIWQVCSTLTQLKHKTSQSGSEGLSNF